MTNPLTATQDSNPFLTNLLGDPHEQLVGKRLWEIGAFIDKKLSLEAVAEHQNKGYIRYNVRVAMHQASFGCRRRCRQIASENFDALDVRVFPALLPLLAAP